MGWFFKKKKNVEISNEPIIANKPTKKYANKTNGMIVKSEAIGNNKFNIQIKYVIGERKYFIDECVDAEKFNVSIDDVNVGSLLSVLYDPNNPNDAVVEHFEEL